jgi:hypothetical protein
MRQEDAMKRFSIISTIIHAFPSDTAVKTATLVDGQARTLSHERGKILHCDFGKLWVTIEGDPEDIILTEDESFEIPSGGRVVISGLESGGYSLAG